MVLFNKTTNITRVLNAALEIEKKKSQKSQQQQASSIRKRKGGEDEKNKIEIDEKQQATTNEDKNNNNKVDKAAEEKRKKQQESESKKQQLQEASQMTAMPSAEKKKLLNLPTSASTTTNITLADESLSPLQLFEKYADDNQPGNNHISDLDRIESYYVNMIKSNLRANSHIQQLSRSRHSSSPSRSLTTMLAKTRRRSSFTRSSLGVRSISHQSQSRRRQVVVIVDDRIVQPTTIHLPNLYQHTRLCKESRSASLVRQAAEAVRRKVVQRYGEECDKGPNSRANT
eukprot:GEZU01013906.1.p1 GENE.GEZU01013906.1~~GEZU01013906.1.p1  ORF type:complete len:286 (-),score=57.15 GEZU01013906.1:501-1358(-)